MASIAEVAAPTPERDERAGTAAALGHQLILVLALGLGAHLALTTALLLLTGANETVEYALYAGAFGLVLPLALAAGAVLARRIAPVALPRLAALLAGGLLGLLVAARCVYALADVATVGSPAFAVGLALWAMAAVVLVRAACRGSLLGPPAAASATERRLLAVPAVLLGLLILGFAPSEILAPVELVGGLAIAASLALVYVQLIRRRIGGRLAPALDALAVVVLLALFNDVQLYDDPGAFFDMPIFQPALHENFYLGPANDVLHGRAMLVDTFSQYGVGLFYFLAGWFALADIGYGAMTLLSALLSAVQLMLAYAILRLAGASRPLALSGGAVAGIGLFFAGAWPAPTSAPSLGGLRYMLPYLVIASAVAGARRAGHFRSWWWTAAGLVGVASVWSIEAFAYCAAAFAGMAALQAGLDVGGPRALAHSFARRLAPVAVAILAVQLSFMLLTRALAGAWPDWSAYLAFFSSYSVDGIVTQPLESWSPAIAIGAVFFASIAGIVVLARGAAATARNELPALLGIAGTVPFGFVSFSYFIGRSFPAAALQDGLPCYLVAGLWLAILERRRAEIPRRLRLAVSGAAIWLIAALGVFVWPTIEQRAADTPLAMGLPDGGAGGALGHELARMWRSEPIDGRFASAEALVREHFPGDGPVPAAATPEATVAVLVQSGRVNALPVSHYLQEGLIMDKTWPRVRSAVAKLEPGTLLLTERTALLGELGAPGFEFPSPLLDRTIAAIQRRFRLRYVAGNPGGLMVVRLESPGGSDSGRLRGSAGAALGGARRVDDGMRDTAALGPEAQREARVHTHVGEAGAASHRRHRPARRDPPGHPW